MVAAAGGRCLNQLHVGWCSPERTHTGARVPQALLSWLLPQTVPICPRASVPDSPDVSGKPDPTLPFSQHQTPRTCLGQCPQEGTEMLALKCWWHWAHRVESPLCTGTGQVSISPPLVVLQC